MIPYSQGEIADKLSILELKQDYGLPAPELDRFKQEWRGNAADLQRLRAINIEAWQVVERIHEYFLGPELPINVYKADVIKDCRRAHELNRMRVAVKNAINEQFGEPLEYKTWKPSTT